jgi:membrane protein YdbS with pleckstrin-like domain
MSYFGDDLMADEHVVYSTSLHWIIFWRPAVLFVIAMVGLVIVSGGWMVLSNLFVPLAGLDALSLFMLYLSSEVRVTDQRVLGKAGWLPHQSLEAPLSEIEELSVRQGILGRMFGYGTIVVSSAGGLRRRLAHIREPLELQRRLREQMAA